MRIAAVQCEPVYDEPERAIDAIVKRLRWADAEAVDLVLFPEAYLHGHSYDAPTIRSRAAAAAATLAKLCADAQAYRAALVCGLFEMVDRDVHNCAVVIEGGQIVGRYAKMHPNEPGVTPGHGFPTFLRSGWRYGMNICADANHPGAARLIAAEGARLIVYPLNNMLRPEVAERWRQKSLANLVDRARDTGCWVASADVAGHSAGLLSYGCTAIVSPSGEVIARVPELENGVAMWDLTSD